MARIVLCIFLLSAMLGFSQQQPHHQDPPGNAPSTAPDNISTTVVLKIKGAPDVAATPIVSDYDGTMALDSEVIRGGRISVGDPIEVVESP